MLVKSRSAFLILAVTCLCISTTQSAPTSNAVTSSSKSTRSASTESPPPFDPYEDFDEKKRDKWNEDKYLDSYENDDDYGPDPYSSNSHKKKTKASHKYYNHMDSSEDEQSYGNYEKSNEKSSKTTTSNKTYTSATPSSTVVVIVSRETPTSIYSGSSFNPSSQQAKDGQGYQDPYYPKDGNNPNGDSKLLEDLSKYHKLVIAFSIVGSVVGIAVILAGFVFGRRYLKKKRQGHLDEEKQLEKGSALPYAPQYPSENAPSSPNDQSPPSTPIAQVSPSLPSDRNMTNAGLQADSFAFRNEQQQNAASLSFAPPHIPTHLGVQYTNFRQNQTLSMVSQTAPSAPSAKELDNLQYYNTFSGTYRNHLDSESEAEYSRAEPSSSSIAHPQPLHHSKSRPASFSSTDLPPPPAYTPSAPPFYILPTTSERDEQSHTQSDSTSLRRHSTTGCNLTDTSQPLPLEHGSDSVVRAPTAS